MVQLIASSIGWSAKVNAPTNHKVGVTGGTWDDKIIESALALGKTKGPCIGKKNLFVENPVFQKIKLIFEIIWIFVNFQMAINQGSTYLQNISCLVVRESMLSVEPALNDKQYKSRQDISDLI